ncbi:hypothetical protein TYRP_023675 [Tyrophagus putrescentiae]|nr:hypothetical protein TYRP_023675 [Tyrophagus putrescentiae]
MSACFIFQSRSAAQHSSRGSNHSATRSRSPSAKRFQENGSWSHSSDKQAHQAAKPRGSLPVSRAAVSQRTLNWKLTCDALAVASGASQQPTAAPVTSSPLSRNPISHLISRRCSLAS